jgi:hypothetical protein
LVVLERIEWKGKGRDRIRWKGRMKSKALSSKLQFDNWKSRKLCSILCVHSDLHCFRNSKWLLYSINLGLALTIMSNIQIWAWLAKAPFTSP